MKFPEILQHHSIQFQLVTKFRAEDMQYDLMYKAIGCQNFPPVCIRVGRLEESEGVVKGLVEQVHAHIGAFLSNCFLNTEAILAQAKPVEATS